MGKNVKKVISLVLVFAMILTGMTFTGFDAKAADAANDTSATAEYEIYPTPRSVVYQDSSFTLADKTNVVYDSTIDEATQKRLNEVLAIQNITGTVTGAVASNGMNVLVLVQKVPMEQLKNGSTTMLLMQMICLTREMHMFWLSRTM